MSDAPTYCPICAEKEPHSCESATPQPGAVMTDAVTAPPVPPPAIAESAPPKRTDGPAAA